MCNVDGFFISSPLPSSSVKQKRKENIKMADVHKNRNESEKIGIRSNNSTAGEQKAQGTQNALYCWNGKLAEAIDH